MYIFYTKRVALTLATVLMILFSESSWAVNCENITLWKPTLLIKTGDKFVYNHKVYTLAPGQTQLWNAAPDAPGQEWRYQELASCDISGRTKSELKLSQLLADEKRLSADPAILHLQAIARTLPNERVERVSALNASNPANVRRVERIINEKTFNFLADPATRNPVYSYDNFLKGVAKYPAFCGSYTDGRDANMICRRALATLFAQMAQDSGAKDNRNPLPEWRQSLHKLRETLDGTTANETTDYNTYVWGCAKDESPLHYQTAWPCGKFTTGEAAGKYLNYFGRGASQIGFYYNYAPLSLSVFGDASVLLNKPGLVAEGWLTFASAIFPFVDTPNLSTPAPLDIIDGSWQPNETDLAQGWQPGFGLTTNVLHGKFECGVKNKDNPAQQKRAEYYRAISHHLVGVSSANEKVTCDNMTISNQHPGGGTATVIKYWDNADSGQPACRLASWEMPWTAIREGSSGQYGVGDYVRCVKYFYPDYDVTDDRNK